MSDYIKREDALEQFDYYDLGEYLTTQIRGMLMDVPSANVAPVRHGYWLPMVAENKMTKDIRGARACSECGASYFSYYDVPDIEDVVPNYCPNCGARMDGDEDEAD